MASDVREQLRLRLEGLEAAGIGWLPKTSGPPAGFEIVAASTSEPIEVEEPRCEANSQEGRQIALNVLRERVSRCERCPELAVSRTQTVFGVGPIGAEVLFLGEAPGGDEDRQGEPFVGAAGQMLNRILTGSGLRRDEIYICNILRCRPPGNRPPQPIEAQNCREYLDETIDLVEPKIIVCWGGTAAQRLLDSSVGISRLRGSLHEYRGIPVICTFHPANLLEGRSPENKKYVWEDMQTLLKFLGRPIPGSTK